MLAYIYIPIVGKLVAIGLCSAAAALSAYQLGYYNRAQLDQTIVLQQEIIVKDAALAQAQNDLLQNKKIAEDAAAREKLASATAADLQTKVSDYEKQLADDANNAGVPLVVHDTKTVTVSGACPTQRQNNACTLTTRDVTGLRSISNRRRGSAGK